MPNYPPVTITTTAAPTCRVWSVYQELLQRWLVPKRMMVGSHPCSLPCRRSNSRRAAKRRSQTSGRPTAGQSQPQSTTVSCLSSTGTRKAGVSTRSGDTTSSCTSCETSRQRVSFGTASWPMGSTTWCLCRDMPCPTRATSSTGRRWVFQHTKPSSMHFRPGKSSGGRATTRWESCPVPVRASTLTCTRSGSTTPWGRSPGG
mmetsp:Transcript_22554/g.62578  ORF Transcript_22554/g.62578 Transcript_22554/m.62578 type:complete len:202 (+) Transcript_22554:1699-2304(+)